MLALVKRDSLLPCNSPTGSRCPPIDATSVDSPSRPSAPSPSPSPGRLSAVSPTFTEQNGGQLWVKERFYKQERHPPTFFRRERGAGVSQYASNTLVHDGMHSAAWMAQVRACVRATIAHARTHARTRTRAHRERERLAALE